MNLQILKRKILKESEDRIISNIEVTKQNGKKAEFRLKGFSGVYNITMKQAPQWFQTFEKKIDKRFDSLETKVDANTQSIKKLETKVDSLETKVDANTQSIKNLDHRISNIVAKNNLRE